MIYKCSLFQFRSATSIVDEYFHLVLCMSLMHYYKKVADKRSETAAPLFFGMLVFVVCIVACFNEVLLLAFVHYSFTSVSICQNLLIELVDRLNQKSCQRDKVLHQSDFYTHVYKTHSESYGQDICYFLDGLAWLHADVAFQQN